MSIVRNNYQMPHGDFTTNVGEWSEAWDVYKKAAENLGFTVHSFSPGITLGGTNEYGGWSFTMPIAAFDMFMRRISELEMRLLEIDTSMHSGPPLYTNFEEVWPRLLIPGEFDAMDACDQARWRGVIEAAFHAGQYAASGTQRGAT